MYDRTLEALRRLWTTFWKCRSPTGADPERGEKDHRRVTARSRFWMEYRAGRREADVRSAKGA